ncbi:hypothetical protein M8C21_019958, partial [Ambrosia artemisiifolia]
DFIAKLSHYWFIDKPSRSNVHGTTADCSDRIFPSDGESLQMNLSGFTLILAEVVTGTRMNESEIDVIDEKLRRYGKMSLSQIARLCFKSCYEVESESKMLEFLKEYGTYILASEDREDETFNTTPGEDDEFSEATLEDCEEDAFSIETLDEGVDDKMTTESFQFCADKQSDENNHWK